MTYSRCSTPQLLSDDSTRDVFLAVVYELLKKGTAADMLQRARD